MVDVDVVRDIEAVTMRTWPPLHLEEHDGWVLRAAGGVTGRANSVWPRAAGVLDIDSKLAAVERFYAKHGLPSMLQLSPASRPADLADLLQARGYAVRAAPRAVQTAPVQQVAEVGDAAAVRIAPELDETWFTILGEVNTTFGRNAATARALLAGVNVPSAYAVLTLDGEPAAAGRGVVDSGWLGIFNMATLPAFRRRGAASAILAALAKWASSLGATNSYLQLEADNAAAPALYEKAGFTPAYEYSYWSLS
ncbi:MAG TPA: GNAT family N-acetyltransferase [Mycobacteriales bacterium]|jgi:GNAT superfamily N-acetyltransferase|nr:GNAT family N-acetyltransferase [Mycobacteriales bacterium]